MQLRKKIISHFLLTIYLLVVLHHSAATSHTVEIGNNSQSKIFHQHEDFKDVHHEHHFHVGIFHFLGHLFENINHSNHYADDHLIIIQETSNKKVVDYNKTVNFYTNENNSVPFSVDAESLPDPPPYHPFLLPRLIRPSTPLRAPPSIV